MPKSPELKHIEEIRGLEQKGLLPTHWTTAGGKPKAIAKMGIGHIGRCLGLLKRWEKTLKNESYIYALRKELKRREKPNQNTP